MPGENGGELAGLFGEMLKGGLEAMAEGREGRGPRHEGRHAGFEAFGQMAAQGMPEMSEYFKSGAPYGPTQEGMMRWINERAAGAIAAAQERLAEVVSPQKHASHHAQNSAVESTYLRSFAEGHQLRSFAESENIRSFAESDRLG